MFQWSFENQNGLEQRWYWFRTASTGPQHSIDIISSPVVTYSGPREANILYTANNFTISLDYLLTAQGNVYPDLAESTRIVNTSATTLEFHFFQYSHYNLSEYAGFDSIQLGRNLRGQFNDAQEIGQLGGLTETITTPGANHGEVDYGTATLDRLNNVGGYTLDDHAGPLGPGDVTYALEWDLNIAPGGSALVSKDNYLILSPEPSGLVWLGCALALYAVRRAPASRPADTPTAPNPFPD
jgi:hypothetical protein